MKPFDLEKALSGDPVVTRDDRRVLFIRKNPDPIAACYEIQFVYEDKNGVIHTDTCCSNGKQNQVDVSCRDLFMATNKKKLYLRIQKKNVDELYYTTYAAEHKEKIHEWIVEGGFWDVEVEVE